MSDRMGLKEAREMIESMRGIAGETTRDLAGGVLVEVGLADPWTQVEGPIGPLYVAWARTGITAVERAGDASAFEEAYQARRGRPTVRVAEMPERLRSQVERRLDGERTSGPPIDISDLTPFEQSVLHKTMEIPFGEVRPYAWIAREIGRPRAVRAVGSALAANPVAFVIPCHRVVRTDGHIGEYGAGGPEAKRAVLRREGLDPAALQRLADSGVRYTGSDTTRIYCFPSCRHARRTMERHNVAFRSAQDATLAGYRACRACRPLESAVFAA